MLVWFASHVLYLILALDLFIMVVLFHTQAYFEQNFVQLSLVKQRRWPSDTLCVRQVE